MNANSLFPAIICLLAAPLHGQQSLESDYRTTGPKITALFEPQRAVLQTSSAVILDGRKEIGYGVVISPDGHILTKASELEGLEKISVTVDRTHYPEVAILITDPKWDVALLKISATGLQPVVYAPTSDVAQGTWLVVNGASTRTARRALAGILSAKPREIPPAGGAALGVVLNVKKDRLEIQAVADGSGAQQAGLEKGDLILTIEGKEIRKIEDISEVLKDHKAGGSVNLTYRRGKKESAASVRLSAKGEMFNETTNRNDMMSGDFSKRRSGFPRVIQHDILGSSRVTGGPVLDLEGRCIGMNIARASRAESFAIPVEELKELAERLVKDQSD